METYLDFYVHRHLANYEKSGIWVYGEHGPISKDIEEFKAIHQKTLDSFQIKKNNGRKTEIEEQYDKIIFGKGNDEKLSETEQSIHKLFIEVLENSVDSLGENKEVYWDAANPLQISYKEDLQNIDIKKRKQLIKAGLEKTAGVFRGNKRVLVSSVETIKKNIIDILNNLEKNVKEGVLYKEAKDFISKKGSILLVREEFKKACDILLNSETNRTKSGSYINFNKEDEISINFIKEMLDIFGTLPAIPSDKKLTGELGENVSEIVSYLIETGTSDVKTTIEDLAKKANEKKQANIYEKTRNKRSEDDMLKFKVVKNISIKEEKSENTLSLQVNQRHRSKVDLIISYKYKDGIKRERASIKNTSNLFNVHIVGKTPLSNILDYIDKSEKFAGHYANLIAVDEMVQGNPEPVLHMPAFHIFRTQMEEIITEQSIINAFKGYNKETPPEVFLVFDYANNKTYAFDMNTIIKKVIDDGNANFLFQKQIGVDSSKKEIMEDQNLSNLTVPFSWNFGEMTRSAISIFKKHKISVSVNISNYVK